MSLWKDLTSAFCLLPLSAQPHVPRRDAGAWELLRFFPPKLRRASEAPPGLGSSAQATVGRGGAMPTATALRTRSPSPAPAGQGRGHSRRSWEHSAKN